MQIFVVRQITLYYYSSVPSTAILKKPINIQTILRGKATQHFTELHFVEKQW